MARSNTRAFAIFLSILGLAGVAEARQSEQYPILFGDGSRTQALVIGFDDLASDGLDIGLDQLAPPPAPSGFDVRLDWNGEQYFVDMRSRPDAGATATFRVLFDAEDLTSLSVSWDADALRAARRSFILQEPGGGGFSLDMTGTSSIAPATVPGIAAPKAFEIVVGLPLPPSALDDSATLDEDGAITIDLLANDTDPSGDGLELFSLTTPAHGTLADNGDGTVDYAPDENYFGPDSFEYTVFNGQLATASVAITVVPVNDPPEALDDSGTVDEDGVLELDLLSNDVDVEADALSLVSFTTPASGSIEDPGLAASKRGAADLVYRPDPDFHGSDSFTYVVDDGNGGQDTGVVVITVNAVNDPPSATDDEVQTTLDNSLSIDVLANDSDVEGDQLSIDSFQQPSHGSTTLDDGGTPEDAADDRLIYTPQAGYHNQDGSPDSFRYTVTDGSATSEATVFVTVLNNNPPTVQADTVTLDEDSSARVAPLANDSDLDGEALTLGSLGQPVNGTAIDNGDGTVTYRPQADFWGQDAFSYEAVDERGARSTSQVAVTVRAVNDPPVAVLDQLQTDQGAPASVDPLANDTDVDSASLSLAGVDPADHGTVFVNADQTVTYTPPRGFAGSDRFEYRVTDGILVSQGVVLVEVRDINVAPVAADDTAEIDEDGQVSIDVLSNDTDADGDQVSITSVSPGVHGQASAGSDGTIVYQPDPDFNGTDLFAYTISDPDGLEATAQVTVTVQAIPDEPRARDDQRSAFEGLVARFLPLENDMDPDGDAIRVSAVGAPDHGTAVVLDGSTVGYTAPSGFAGTASFSYEATDATGRTASASIFVDVKPIPGDDDGVTVETEADAPNGGDGNGDGVPDAEQAHVASLPSATSGDYVTVAAEPGSELLAVTSTADNPASEPPPADAQFPAGFLAYELRGGTGNETQTVTLHMESGEFDAYYKFGPTPENTTPHWYNFAYDGETGAVVSGNTITLHFRDGRRGDDDLTVNGVIVDPGAPAKTANSLPIAAEDLVATMEDVPVQITPLANDSDPDMDELTIRSYTAPANGSIDRSGHTLTYTPDADFFGQDTFSYVVADGKGGSVSAQIRITITPVNDPPIAQTDHFLTDEDIPLSITTLLSNDTDVDDSSASLTLELISAAQHGLVARTSSGGVIFTPAANFSGEDRFGYTVTDGKASSAGVVVVTVASVNDPPTATEDHVVIGPDAAEVQVFPLANDTDIERDMLSLVDVGSAAFGTATLVQESILYVPGAGFPGRDSLTYVVRDAPGAESVGTVYIVRGAAAPVATDDLASTPEDTPITISPLANDTDPNGDTLRIVAVQQPTLGTAELMEGGLVVYTPAPDVFGEDVFQYSVADDSLHTDGHIRIEITPVNDAPRFPEGSPVFVAPGVRETIQVGGVDPPGQDPDKEVVFSFREAVDPEGDPIEYTWSVYPDSSRVEPQLTGQSLGGTFHVTLGALATMAASTPGEVAEVWAGVTAADAEARSDSELLPLQLSRGLLTSTGSDDVPEEFALHTNFPNPFNPTTTIRYDVPEAGHLLLEVFDVRGKRVAVLADEVQSPGKHVQTFDAGTLPSGVYLYRLTSGSFTQVKTMILIK
ncbi:MAG: tandem-95 repeat protein [Rhodothermales bacterium]|nr:tandem-95 repeat protein [Rhodothermales bacterium]MBO6779020.1 tandem-95 repeat protein [Rhodothermales bacterium]